MTLLITTLVIAFAVGLGAWAGQEQFQAAMEFVERDLREKLRRLRISTHNLRSLLITWMIAVLGAVFILSILLGMPILGVVLGILMVCLPWYVVRRMAENRREKLEDQLADSMVSLSNAIQAGLSLAQSLEILSEQTPPPISDEFQQIVGEYQMGKPLERCLEEAKQRLRSENFALFAAAMEASRQSGGRLNETVDRIAHSVRELQRLERKVQAETAQARSSAFYMAIAPVAVLAVYYFILDKNTTAMLFTTPLGNVMLSVALVLNVVAYLWARQILNPDI